MTNASRASDETTPNRTWVAYAFVVGLSVVVPAWFGGILWGAYHFLRAMTS